MVAGPRNQKIFAAVTRAKLAAADAYIAAIETHAKATGRKLPVPNRYAIFRQLG